jgi:pyruvate dehydrogenase E2 component (dihydrolipoamide acetyltransferase)
LATEVRLPRFNMDMTEGTIVRWFRAEGERVGEGDPLCEVETDKVNMEVEAPAAGILCSPVGEGETVPVATVIARLAADEAEASAIGSGAPAGGDGGATGGRVRAVPRARRLAAEHGIQLAALADADGRVSLEAVQAAIARSTGGRAEGAPAAGPRPLDPTRRAIAARMTRAQAAPHITLEVEVRFGPLLGWRAERDPRPSTTALVAAATLRALRAHPLINSTFEEGLLTTHERVNLGVAVARPQGLVVPVLRDADGLTVIELDRRLRELIQRARAGRLGLDDTAGGTFSISSLGGAGVDRFTALVNPPQVAILAVGRIADRVAPIRGGIGVERTACLSLGCDHRVVDGAPGAAFLASLKEAIEEPDWLDDAGGGW